MHDSILQSINSYGTFSNDDLQVFLSYLRPVKVYKGQTILKKGDICQTFSFINRGSFIQSFKDEDLNERIINLFVKHDWVLNHTSFTSQKPSAHTIEAFEDSDILTINIHQVHELIGKYPAFFALGKILEVVAPGSDLSATPDEKYLWLLEQKPMIIRTFPLKYIASYLGITPETLSRVRSRID